MSEIKKDLHGNLTIDVPLVGEGLMITLRGFGWHGHILVDHWGVAGEVSAVLNLPVSLLGHAFAGIVQVFEEAANGTGRPIELRDPRSGNRIMRLELARSSGNHLSLVVDHTSPGFRRQEIPTERLGEIASAVARLLASRPANDEPAN